MKSLDPIRMGGIIVALALALALSGCSALKLGYVNLPNLAYWWLDNYVAFSEEQAPLARDELARLYAWHRQQELPRILDIVVRLEQLAPGEVSAQQVCGIAAEGRVRLKAAADHAEPAIVSLAATLTNNEHRHLARKFRRNNEAFQKEWIALPRAELVQLRQKQMIERMETFYGRLEEPQRVVLRQRLEPSVFDPARSLAERERRQQELLQVLRKVAQRGAPEAEARALVRGWIARIDKPQDPAYRSYQEALLQETCATFAAVHETTSAAQREQAARRLRAYQRDIRDLMAQQP